MICGSKRYWFSELQYGPPDGSFGVVSKVNVLNMK